VQGGAAGWDAVEIASLDEISAIRHQPEGAASAHLVAGSDVDEAWGGATFPLSGAAFVQVNREAGEVLVQHVLASAGQGGRDAVDAYCGVGVYGRALARNGWSVTGIELDPEACRAARHDVPEGLRIVEGAVEERLADALPADLVVLNPPRTGLDARIPDLLVARPPRTLVYVSCDPATLARDAARLRDAYELVDLRSFDLFPQTPHVETVARFLAVGVDGAGGA
jgi:23S rRNA (uracil1939-C5)-methyltransferase